MIPLYTVFAFLQLSSFWKEPDPLFVQIWISFYASMIGIKFDWNWPASSGEGRFLKIFSNINTSGLIRYIMARIMVSEGENNLTNPDKLQ
jgi:hypothetical protein